MLPNRVPSTFQDDAIKNRCPSCGAEPGQRCNDDELASGGWHLARRRDPTARNVVGVHRVEPEPATLGKVALSQALRSADKVIDVVMSRSVAEGRRKGRAEVASSLRLALKQSAGRSADYRQALELAITIAEVER